MSRNIWLDLLSLKGYETVWACLSLKDIAALASSSTSSEEVLIPEGACAEIVSRYRIGLWRVHSFQPMKMHNLLRVIQLLHTPIDVNLLLDDRNGRLLLDIGGIDESHGTETDGTETIHEDPESVQIFKEFERCSYDEYDDFQPRHPMPKDRAHRRGDSYFNSDVETVISELGNMSVSGDLRNLARSVLASPDLAATATAASSGNSARNRILAKRNSNSAVKSPGLPPPIPRK